MHVLLRMPVKVKRIDDLQTLLPHNANADADDDIADVKNRMMLMVMLNMILLMLREAIN